MHDDLIALAKKIAELDPNRPRQANLRRAVSTAYYAVFHYLIDEACCVQIGTQNSQKGVQIGVCRLILELLLQVG